jgi:quercetin dioxygenase-like cupin family protein
VKHVHYDDVALQEVKEPGAEGVRVRWLIGKEDGAPHFYMRRFELVPGGHTLRHRHAWEHEVYILEGEGTVFCEGREEDFAAGDVIYVAPDEEHSFAAGGRGSVAFLCLVPRQALQAR